jgi:hypothetical protein
MDYQCHEELQSHEDLSTSSVLRKTSEFELTSAIRDLGQHISTNIREGLAETKAISKFSNAEEQKYKAEYEKLLVVNQDLLAESEARKEADSKRLMAKNSNLKRKLEEQRVESERATSKLRATLNQDHAADLAEKLKAKEELQQLQTKVVTAELELRLVKDHHKDLNKASQPSWSALQPYYYAVDCQVPPTQQQQQQQQYMHTSPYVQQPVEDQVQPMQQQQQQQRYMAPYVQQHQQYMHTAPYVAVQQPVGGQVPPMQQQQQQQWYTAPYVEQQPFGPPMQQQQQQQWYAAPNVEQHWLPFGGQEQPFEGIKVEDQVPPMQQQQQQQWYTEPYVQQQPFGGRVPPNSMPFECQAQPMQVEHQYVA